MKRAIHIFPDTQSQAFIEAFRARFDPLHRFIAAHITVVFPFESPMADAELIEHCMEMAAAVGPFSFTVAHPERSADDHIWLPLSPVPSALVQLKEAICSGALAGHHKQAGVYRPHLTIARPPLPARIEDALAEVPSRFPFALEARSITIERIAHDGMSQVVQTIPLADEPGARGEAGQTPEQLRYSNLRNHAMTSHERRIRAVDGGTCGMSVSALNGTGFPVD